MAMEANHTYHSSRFRRLLMLLLAIVVLSCDADDRQNTKGVRPEPETATPESNSPGCSRMSSAAQQGSSGGGGGFGCERRHERSHSEARHQRERPVRRENENGFVYPCPDHIFPFCTDENPFGITYKSATRGYAAFPRTDSIGCLGNAPGPSWFYMQIDHPGDLLIYIEQKGFLGKLDVDFACWGPFEAASKKDFVDKLCGYRYHLNIDSHLNHRPDKGDHRFDTGGYPFGNLVDCSFDPAGTEWCFIPHAKTGEWYLLLLTNYSRKKGKIHFSRVDGMSTATTDCRVVVPVTLNLVPGGLRQIDDHTSAICLYENKALVTIELETDEGYTLPRNALANSKVTVHANNKDYSAILKKDHFECEIDIENDTTEYSASILCPEPFFDLETEVYRIVRSSDCDRNRIQFSEGELYHAGDMSTMDLVRGDRPLAVDFSDPFGIVSKLPGTGSINVNDYDFTVDYDRMFFERVDVLRNGKQVELVPQLKGDWCDCFVPDSVTFTLRMVPNNGDIHALPYEIPIELGILHETVWIGRCLWALISTGILFLFVLYLTLLLRKNRFKLNAMIVPTYYDFRGNRVELGGSSLRKAGFRAWFARWFLPGDERITLGWSAPDASIRFVASDSSDVVVIPGSSINPETMHIRGYKPDRNTYQDSPVKIAGNEIIRITSEDGEDAGFLRFVPGEKNDGSGYRIMLVLLKIGLYISIAVLIFFILRGLIA